MLFNNNKRFSAIIVVVLAAIIMVVSAETPACSDQVVAKYICSLCPEIIKQANFYHHAVPKDPSLLEQANNFFLNQWNNKLISVCEPGAEVIPQSGVVTPVASEFKCVLSEACDEDAGALDLNGDGMCEGTLTRYVSHALFIESTGTGCTPLQILGVAQCTPDEDLDDVKDIESAFLELNTKPARTNGDCTIDCDAVATCFDECTSSSEGDDSSDCSDESSSCQGSCTRGSGGSCCPKLSKRSSNVGTGNIGATTVNISTGDNHEHTVNNGRRRGRRYHSSVNSLDSAVHHNDGL